MFYSKPTGHTSVKLYTCGPKQLNRGILDEVLLFLSGSVVVERQGMTLSLSRPLKPLHDKSALETELKHELTAQCDVICKPSINRS